MLSIPELDQIIDKTNLLRGPSQQVKLDAKNLFDGSVPLVQSWHPYQNIIQLHILLPDSSDLSFYAEVMKALGNYLENPLNEIMQWGLLATATIFVAFERVIGMVKFFKSRKDKHCDTEEIQPLQALQALRAPNNDTPSAPRLYPRFGN